MAVTIVVPLSDAVAALPEEVSVRTTQQAVPPSLKNSLTAQGMKPYHT